MLGTHLNAHVMGKEYSLGQNMSNTAVIRWLRILDAELKVYSSFQCRYIFTSYTDQYGDKIYLFGWVPQI
jgi:hypothetical protein